jgi:lipocalin
MGSSRIWFGSGAILAGVGAAMLCGTGTAAADTGADATSTGRSTHAVSVSRVASQVSQVASRVVSQGAERVARSNRAAAVAVTGGPNRADRANRPRPAFPTPAPAVTTPVVPDSDPVDPAQFAGTYYEQGSVKQFFSIGLVNTKATYSVKPDGTIRVENSGNYFFNRGPQSSIVGSAVPVNETNTALNVGFFGSSPSANPPGNYTILAHAPDYSWVIVSDPSGQSGYILTRDKNISPQQYQELLTQARALGVRGNITPTVQYS